MTPSPTLDLAQRLKRHFPRAWEFLVARFDARTALGLQLTIGLVTSVLLTWGFLALADEFPEKGGLDRLDAAVALWLQIHGTETGESIFVAVSWLGAPALVGIELIVAIVLAIRRAWLRVIVLVAAVVGGEVIDLALKAAFRRTRPSYASEFIQGQSWSFPSGHALESFVGYTMLAYFVLERVHARRARVAVAVGAIVLIGAIGFSRLYLGVHYMSDVVAGYLAGGAWTIVCITAYQIARRRHVATP